VPDEIHQQGYRYPGLRQGCRRTAGPGQGENQNSPPEAAGIVSWRQLRTTLPRTLNKKRNREGKIMNRQFIFTLGLGLTLLVTSASAAEANDLQCEIKAVDENIVVLDCGRETGRLAKGDKVLVKTSKPGGRTRGTVPGY
jgi:hypothetical protein